MGNNNKKIREINPEFLDSLKSGELSKLKDMVKESKDLIMCFRNGYINVYYNSHSLFKITQQVNNYLVEFNMGHARYTEPPIIEKRLAGLKKQIPDFKHNDKDNNTSFHIERNGKPFDFSNVTSTYISFLNDFFDKEKNKDKNRSKKSYKEKCHQHRFFSERFGKDEKYLCYDIEYRVPRDDSSQRNFGSVDCMALGQHRTIMQ